MDKPKRLRRVTVKTERTFVFRSHGGVQVEWCAECGAEVGKMNVDGAARETGVSEMAIYKLIDAISALIPIQKSEAFFGGTT